MLIWWESQQQLAEGILLYFKAHEATAPRMYQKDLILKELITFKIASNPDTPCLHEAMLVPYAAQFREATKKEANKNPWKGPWWVIGKSDVPSITKILLKRIKVYKPEARLNLWGHKQVIGVCCWETYSLVARWNSLRLMLILLIIHGLSMGQLDCVMAYLKADVSSGHVYIEISKGFEFESKDSHCLHVLKGIYSRQDAGMTGDQYLVKGLKDLVFEQSQLDEWVFYQGTTIFMIYVDEGILMDPDNSEIEVMSDLPSKFEGQDKGDLSDYLGVKVRNPLMDLLSLCKRN
jgi:Reverse transcriptase (RNA-dependent DNA polymerase)